MLCGTCPAKWEKPKQAAWDLPSLIVALNRRIRKSAASVGSPQSSVFWKTATSHGFRDAWSVAVFDHYVLAVWIGNFDGKRNAAFIGRTAAAPLLFQMIDGLRAMEPSRLSTTGAQRNLIV